MSVDEGRLECKLAIEHSVSGASPDQTVAIYNRLGRDRAAIEAELGFFDLDWGKPTPTRIYRRRRAVIEDRGAWPEAFDWLVRVARTGVRSAAVRSVLTDPHCLRKDGQDTTVKGQPFYPKGVRLDAEIVLLP
jgi:hypothetical protein